MKNVYNLMLPLIGLVSILASSCNSQVEEDILSHASEDRVEEYVSLCETMKSNVSYALASLSFLEADYDGNLAGIILHHLVHMDGDQIDSLQTDMVTHFTDVHWEHCNEAAYDEYFATYPPESFYRLRDCAQIYSESGGHNFPLLASLMQKCDVEQSAILMHIGVMIDILADDELWRKIEHSGTRMIMTEWECRERFRQELLAIAIDMGITSGIAFGFDAVPGVGELEALAVILGATAAAANYRRCLTMVNGG